MQQKMVEEEEEKEEVDEEEEVKENKEDEEEEEGRGCAVFSTSPLSPEALSLSSSSQPDSVHIDLSVSHGKSYWVSQLQSVANCFGATQYIKEVIFLHTWLIIFLVH